MISVVVVNWNSGNLLADCVASLLRHAPGFEIVIVDNASDDSSLAFLSGRGSGVVLKKNEENFGFAAGNNIGWRMCSGDKVLFLNPDAECRQGSIENLEVALNSGPKVWAAGGLLLNPSGSHQQGFNVRTFPTVASVAAEMLLLDEIWPGNPWTSRHRMTDWDHATLREVEQPAAACLMVRKEVLERLGGFDERFRPAWFEDVDLCRRIRAGGGTILLQPAARFMHHGGSSLRRLPYGLFLQHYHTNLWRYFDKHHGPAEAERIRKLIVAGMRLRAAAALFSSPRRGESRASCAQLYWNVARRFASIPEAAS